MVILPELALVPAGSFATGCGAPVGAAGGSGVVEGVQVGAAPPPNQLLTQDTTLPSMVAVTSAGGTQEDGDGDCGPYQLFSQVTTCPSMVAVTT